MRVAIIPARGGSKRIPRKNVKVFCGRPIISWSIAAAVDSGCFDRILVSTDDEEVTSVALQCGAEVPFLRPAELANDNAGTIAVVAHAVGWLTENGCNPTQVCCIYATAPFIRPEELKLALARLEKDDCDYVFPVARYPFPIQRAIRIVGQGRPEMLQPDQFEVRSQDLEETFHDAGQFYWGRSAAWTSGKRIFAATSAVIELPHFRVQDIDTPEDWVRAEMMFGSFLREFDRSQK